MVFTPSGKAQAGDRPTETIDSLIKGLISQSMATNPRLITLQTQSVRQSQAKNVLLLASLFLTLLPFSGVLDLEQAK